VNKIKKRNNKKDHSWDIYDILPDDVLCMIDAKTFIFKFVCLSLDLVFP